jgi:hypothetical protein
LEEGTAGIGFHVDIGLSGLILLSFAAEIKGGRENPAALIGNVNSL